MEQISQIILEVGSVGVYVGEVGLEDAAVVSGGLLLPWAPPQPIELPGFVAWENRSRVSLMERPKIEKFIFLQF